MVWSTKYCYGVLYGEVQTRFRDLIRQTCDTSDIQILKGLVSKDYIHLHVSYPAELSVSDMVKRLKGRSTKMLLSEYSELRRRYYGGHLWGIGYSVWSTGYITDEMVQEYLNHYGGGPNSDKDFILD